MKTLQIETGKRKYDLAGKVQVEFNPTDLDFLERVFDVFRQAESSQKETEAELKNADTETVFQIARRKDEEIRGTVNGLLGTDVCTPLFDTMNTFARVDGLPLWANVLMVILDECYDNLPQEDKATRARIDKYTRKYKRK